MPLFDAKGYLQLIQGEIIDFFCTLALILHHRIGPVVF